MSKVLDVVSAEDAKAKINDIKVWGNPDAWQLLAKASSESQGWMKSTKALEVLDKGCLVQVSTQQKNPDGSWAVAEALCFVPDVYIVSVFEDETSNEVIGRHMRRYGSEDESGSEVADDSPST